MFYYPVKIILYNDCCAQKLDEAAECVYDRCKWPPVGVAPKVNNQSMVPFFLDPYTWISTTMSRRRLRGGLSQLASQDCRGAADSPTAFKVELCRDAVDASSGRRTFS